MSNHSEDVRAILLHARLCCEGWWLLEGSHNQRELVLSAFHFFPVVYETLRPALYSCFIVKLCSLFGSSSHDITIKSLPSAEQDSDFSRIWDIGRRLYRYRSKIIAHCDTRQSPEEIAKETGLTYDGVRQLLEDTCNLFDRVATEHNQPRLNDCDFQKEFVEFLMCLATPTMGGKPEQTDAT